HGPDCRARTSRPQVPWGVDVGVQGVAAPAAGELLAGPVAFVDVAAGGALLRRIGGIDLDDFDAEAFAEIGQLLLGDPPAGVAHQPVHAPGEVRVSEVELPDHDATWPLNLDQSVQDASDLRAQE